MEVIIPRLIFVLKEFNIKITITVSKAPLQIFIPIKNSPAKQFITCLFFLSSSQAFFKLYSSKSPLWLSVMKKDNIIWIIDINNTITAVNI